MWSFLPFVGDEGYQTYAAWSIAQEMHTPDDIADPNPPKDDQPYAGVLYVDSVLYTANQRWAHAWFMKTGVVGPASQADDVQKQFHETIGADEPMARRWDTQLPNEPVLNLGYSVAHLMAQETSPFCRMETCPSGHRGARQLLHRRGSRHVRRDRLEPRGCLGWDCTALRLNAASTAGVGPVNGWSVGLSGGLLGYGVAHYLPLDGTVFHDSRSVDSEPLIGMATLGMCVRHQNLRAQPGWDFLYQDIRSGAETRRVRDPERVLVLLSGQVSAAIRFERMNEQ